MYENIQDYSVVKIDTPAPIFHLPYYCPIKDDEGMMELTDLL
jgi:hypothetical protein